MPSNQTIYLLSLHASAVLQFLLIQGLAVVVLRIIRQPYVDPSASAAKQRRWVLWSFGLFLLGALVREEAVRSFGMSGWPIEAVLLSMSGRLLQLVSILIFIGRVTYDMCWHWVWVGMLISALVFAVLAVPFPT
jgi:hypothetical protein